MSTENTDQNQGQSPDKIKKRFDFLVKQLSEIVGSEDALLPSKKISKPDLVGLAAELLKEKKEENKKEIMDGLRKLLDGYASMKNEIRTAEKNLKKLEEDKMKEFTKSAESLFNRVTEMKEKQAQYVAGLSEATGGPAPDASSEQSKDTPETPSTEVK